jgi:hypothetical protein
MAKIWMRVFFSALIEDEKENYKRDQQHSSKKWTSTTRKNDFRVNYFLHFEIMSPK